MAAEQGEVEALYQLGVLFDNGLGIPSDPERAFHFLSEAAISGEVRALNALGAMYASGRAVGRDNVMAYTLYYLATQRGDMVARTNMAMLGRSMSRSEVREARSLAAEWKPGNALPVRRGH